MKMKLKHLLALVVAAVSTTGAWAQEDVTGTYLTNADFSASTAIDNHLCGYGADMSKNGTTYYGFQTVTGWELEIISADNKNTAYPNSGVGGAVFAYGSTCQLKGNNTAAPTAGPDGNAGNGLGFFCVWGCGGYYYQDVELPAGKYTITIPMYNQSGTQSNTSYSGFFADGGDSYTVPVNPKTGSWVSQTVTFTLEAKTKGQIRLGYKSTGEGSGKNPMLFIDGVKIEYTDPLKGAREDLQSAIDAAPAAPTDLGEGIFQFNSVNVANYSSAIEAAKAAHDDNDATAESLKEAKANLMEAIEALSNTYGKLFNIILTYEDWKYDNKAMTYIAGGRSNQGNYTIQYEAEANPNLAQAFTFTWVGDNNYKLSQIDADGKARYMTTGTPYGGNNNQIRTSTNADDAMLVTVMPTATEGVYNLLNVAANNYLGSQDQGVYTVNSHIDFKIVEAQKPSVVINTTAAGWGTVILPFAFDELPADVKAYTCAAVDGATLTLVEATALEANKPYIIEGAWEATLTGDAQGTALTYTEGLLTGTYADMEAANGTYVMQKHDDTVGFYQVDTESAQPKVPANHAYLAVPDSGVKAFFLGDEAADAIHSVFTAVANGDIYDLAGRKAAQMNKGGVYVVNGKKIIIK